MGSLLDSPTMGFLGYLSLVALLSCGIQGASLPYKNGYQFHLNQKGVIMDLAMKDLNPLVGGKAHVELPLSPVWKMLEVDAQLLKPVINTLEKTTLPVWKLVDVEAPFLKPLIIALEKNTIGRIYDVMTVKADMTFNAEEILKGIFNVAVDYTLVHKDGTEEKATLLIQGKNESGKHVTSLEIIPKNNVVMPEKKIFFPLEMIFTCNWPSAHTLTIKGDFGRIFLNMLRKAFVDVKVIGSGTELLGDYEVFRHLNWNIVNLKNIDVEWTGKVMCTGLKVFKTPMVSEGKLLFKDFVVDMKMVEKLMDVPYTLIFKSHPLTVALLPFFQYP